MLLVQKVNDMLEILQVTLLEEMVIGDRGEARDRGHPEDRRGRSDLENVLSEGECRRLVSKFHLENEDWVQSAAESLDKEMNVCHLHFPVKISTVRIHIHICLSL